MSLCKFFPLFQIKQKSLPRHRHSKVQNPDNEAPLCACGRGSMTLEAAIVLPLSAAFLTFFLFLFRVMQVEQIVQNALIYAGREAAAYGAGSSEVTILALGNGFFYKEVADSQLVKTYVQNGAAGIVLLESSVEEDCVNLRAVYRVKFPVGFFSINGIDLVSESKNRIWNGQLASGGEDSDPIVYYTATGSVYHLTKSCSYLDLSIRAVARSDLSGLRNKSGGKYYACSLCHAKDSDSKTVYITDYGAEYHDSLQCSALKRTIYEVRLSQVGSRKPCSKCAKGA